MKVSRAGPADGRRWRDGKRRTLAMALVRTTGVGDLTYHHNASSGREALGNGRVRRSGSLAWEARPEHFPLS